jgi:hypothetical protein
MKGGIAVVIRRLAQIWVWLVVILPLVVGGMLIVNPSGALPAGAEVADVARAFGFRNFALSITVLIAIFTQPQRVIAFLLIVRGLSEVGDSIASVIGAKQVDGSIIFPVIAAIITFACAYYLLKQEKIEESKT